MLRLEGKGVVTFFWAHKEYNTTWQCSNIVIAVISIHLFYHLTFYVLCNKVFCFSSHWCCISQSKSFWATDKYSRKWKIRSLFLLKQRSIFTCSMRLYDLDFSCHREMVRCIPVAYAQSNIFTNISKRSFYQKKSCNFYFFLHYWAVPKKPKIESVSTPKKSQIKSRALTSI